MQTQAAPAKTRGGTRSYGYHGYILFKSGERKYIAGGMRDYIANLLAAHSGYASKTVSNELVYLERDGRRGAWAFRKWRVEVEFASTSPVPEAL